ncbi:hypothetical protein ABK040_007484 [Willaertia magna]
MNDKPPTIIITNDREDEHNLNEEKDKNNELNNNEVIIQVTDNNLPKKEEENLKDIKPATSNHLEFSKPNIPLAKEKSFNQYYHDPNNETKLFPYLFSFRKLRKLGPIPFAYLRFLTFCFLFFILLSILHIPHIVIFSRQYHGSFLFRISFTNIDINSYTNQLILGIFELLISIVTVVFFTIMIKYGNRINDKITAVFINDFAVHVTNIPEDEVYKHGNERIFKLFSHFGTIYKLHFIFKLDNIPFLEHKIKKTNKKLSRLRRKKEMGNTCFFFSFKEFYWRNLLNFYLHRLEWTKEKIRKDPKLAAECTGDAIVIFTREIEKQNCLQSFRGISFQFIRNWLCIGNDITTTNNNQNGNQTETGTPQAKQPIQIDNDLKRIRVSDAKEPSDIYYENYRYSFLGKMIRRIFWVFVFIIFLGIILIITLVTRMNLHVELQSSIEWITEGLNFSKIGPIVSLVIAIVVFLLATLIVKIFTKMSKYERYRSRTSRYRSLMYKSAFASFMLYTTFILCQLSVPKNGDNFNDYSQKNVTIPHGLIPNTKVAIETSSYYSAIISIIGIGILRNIFTEFLKPFVFSCCKRKAERNAIDQEELDDIYRAPHYPFSQRYGSQIRHIAIAILFSAELPFVVFVVCIALFISYFIDKYNILRVYRKAHKENKDHFFLTSTKILIIVFCFRYVILTPTRWYFTLCQLGYLSRFKTFNGTEHISHFEGSMQSYTFGINPLNYEPKNSTISVLTSEEILRMGKLVMNEERKREIDKHSIGVWLSKLGLCFRNSRIL